LLILLHNFHKIPLVSEFKAFAKSRKNLLSWSKVSNTGLNFEIFKSSRVKFYALRPVKNVHRLGNQSPNL
jgi:hypothetical protein